MTRETKEIVSDIIGQIEELERRLAVARLWPEDRQEEDLSPLAEKWLALDRLHEEHLGGEVGYRRTLHVFVWLALECRTPGIDTGTPVPEPVNEEAVAIMMELATHESTALLEALGELVPEDVSEVADPTPTGTSP